MSFNDLPFFPAGSLPAENGKDGVSPTISIEDITGGHRLIIIDATGRKTLDVLDGTVGPAGAQGPQGIQGIQGLQGEPGKQGEAGPQGPQGIQGEKGDKGDKGEQGIQGEKGESGKDGIDGKAGADGKDGQNGISATHSWNGTVLTLTSASGTSSIDLKGEPGSAGKDGENGDDGKSAYEYAQSSGYLGTESEFAEILANALDKRKIGLGLHTDGLLYLFIDSVPVGTGIELSVNANATE
jgi:hypothetical protein